MPFTGLSAERQEISWYCAASARRCASSSAASVPSPRTRNANVFVVGGRLRKSAISGCSRMGFAFTSLSESIHPGRDLRPIALRVTPGKRAGGVELQKVGEREADLSDEHHSIHVRPRDVVLFDGDFLRTAEHQVAHVDAIRRHDGGERLEEEEVAGQNAGEGSNRDHEKREHEGW